MIEGFFSGMNDKLPEKYHASLILDKEFLAETLERVDKNHDGQISSNEIEAFVRQLLMQI